MAQEAAAGADRPQVEVTSTAELRAWLSEHHTQTSGVWLVTWKKPTPDSHVSYEELVRELLCFGWIDSQARGVDAQRSSIFISPRRPRSKWSKPNKIRVSELEAAGLMQPAGAAVVAAAKASGTWTGLDDVENLIEPEALRVALDAEPRAREHWDAFSRTVRRATLEWIGNAKRPVTLERRIAEVVAASADNQRTGPAAYQERRDARERGRAVGG